MSQIALHRERWALTKTGYLLAFPTPKTELIFFQRNSLGNLYYLISTYLFLSFILSGYWYNLGKQKLNNLPPPKPIPTLYLRKKYNANIKLYNSSVTF